MISGTLFILGQTLARNVETLLITRFLAGVFAAAPLTNCSGMLYLSTQFRMR
jgi:MFS transporter, DHA1 family, multidrug resistance protein